MLGAYQALARQVGLGTVKDGKTANQMVEWARKYGMQSTIHTGGPSIPGSGLIDADMVLETGTDVVGHINGGHSALPDDQIVCLCESCQAALEIVHNGNERAALLTLNTARELDKLDQIILGTDGPAGSGVQPLGIVRMVAMLSSLGDVKVETAFCFATGNTARRRNLDAGLIEEGFAADFVLMDQAQHAPGKDLLESVQLGNLPGIGMTVIDGKITSQRSRNTPPAQRLPENLDVAGVGVDDAHHHANRRRLAGAVGTEQAVDCPMLDFERYCIHGKRVGERFGDVVYSNDGTHDCVDVPSWARPQRSSSSRISTSAR